VEKDCVVMAKTTLPSIKRQYHQVYGVDSGLDYSIPSTLIGETYTPSCSDVTLCDKIISKTLGASVFAGTDISSLSGTFMMAKHYVKNNESEKLVVHTTDSVYYYDAEEDEFVDITDEPLIGDEDNSYCAAVVNDYYVFSDGIAPIYYWDMSAGTVAELTGATTLACNAMAKFGERLNLYGIPDYPRRVQWTVVGGLTTPPSADDWTNTGAGDTDLDGVFGEDVIMTAYPLGNYIVIYGKKTIAMQEYTAKSADNPYAFYTRVAGVGTPSKRGVANLGNSHIFLGWDSVYLYGGGTDVEDIGEKIATELFSLINPEYIHRSFVVYLEEQNEVRIFFPLIGSELPNAYFSYNLQSKSWSRGIRSYTGYGSYKRVSGAVTWDTIATATTSWEATVGRWNDVINEDLSPINIYGDENGIVYWDNASVYNNVDAAIESWYTTKDFVIGDSYVRKTTTWMEFNFEARGHSVTLSYSTDFGATWVGEETFELTSCWEQYSYQFEAYSPQIRFRFYNDELDETFEVRSYEIGYVPATDRGVRV